MKKNACNIFFNKFLKVWCYSLVLVIMILLKGKQDIYLKLNKKN